MTVNLKIAQTPEVALYSGISGTAVSMVITPYPVDLDGVKLTMSDFGSIGYCTIDPKISGYEEIVSFTGITDNGDGTATLTGLTRDLQSKYPYTGSGTGKLHGSSAVVVFSNNPQIFGRLAGKDNDETITGAWTFTGHLQLTYTPTSGNDVANKTYVDTVALGTLTTLDIIVPATAGATVVAGNVVYLDTATSQWKLADAGASATSEEVVLGIAQGAGVAAGAIAGGVLLQGADTKQSGLTAGTVMYLGTAGAISATPGTKTVAVGIAKSATELYFVPHFDQVLTQDQINALAGTSGTPSASNKFVTNADTTGTGSVVRTSALSSYIKSGGDGTDGALAITSGTTNIDCGAAAVVVKNYTSISITGTGALTFSNPADGGTLIILRSQGDVTLTSSAAPMIDASGMGSKGGVGGSVASGVAASGTAGTAPMRFLWPNGAGGGGGPSAGGGGGAIGSSSTWAEVPNDILRAFPNLFMGAGGGGGGASNASGSGTAVGGTGGRGGGCLVIDCAGAWNFTTAGGISVAGKDGTNGVAASPGTGSDAQGGGGGSGGCFYAMYGTLTANTGTVTVTAGAGGTGAANGSPGGVYVSYGSGGGGGTPLAAGTSGTASTSAVSGGAGAVGVATVVPNWTLIT